MCTFFTMEGGESESGNFYTANFKHFWRPVVIMCLAMSNNLLLVLQDAPKSVFFSFLFFFFSSSTNSRSFGQQKKQKKKQKNDKDTFFHPSSPFHGNFCTLQQYRRCNAPSTETIIIIINNNSYKTLFFNQS